MKAEGEDTYKETPCVPAAELNWLAEAPDMQRDNFTH